MTPREGRRPAKHSQSPAAKEKLPSIQEWLRLAIQGSRIGLWYWNEVTKKTFFDATTREMFGLSLDSEVTLEIFYKALHPSDLDRVIQNWRFAVEQGLPYEIEYRAVRPDGTIRWIHSRGSGSYDKAGKPRYMVGVAFDITERKEGERERLELGGRLINAQEQERSRLARELHDDFGQRLSMVSVGLASISERVRDPALSEPVLELLKSVDEIAVDVQVLSHRLHSPKLELLGLAQAVSSSCQEFSRDHRIDIDFDHTDIPNAIPHESALCLFRIVQEGLRNVKKHSRASRVEVRLNGSSGEICLTLRDDGVGFDPSATYTSNGIGIQSMKERVRLLNGTFQIQSALGQGTQITVRIP